jgi:hypothetical protein
MERNKRGGRPGRQPAEGERVKLGLRVTPSMKKKLDEAAASSGRSQSQEAELRLERSFERQHMLKESLSLAYGPEAAGILLTLGMIMEAAGRSHMWASAWADVPSRAHLYDVHSEQWNRLISSTWTDDPASRKIGVLAVIAVLAMFPPRHLRPSDLVLDVPVHVLQSLRTKRLPDAHGAWREQIEMARSLLSPDVTARPESSVINDLIDALRALADLLPGIIDRIATSSADAADHHHGPAVETIDVRGPGAKVGKAKDGGAAHTKGSSHQEPKS